MRVLWCAAAAFAMTAGHATAQAPKTPASAEPKAGEAEVVFVNGSNVKLVVLSTTIDVETPYGKLAIPFRDVRSIEFGRHLPDGADERIAAAVKALSGENFRERETAAAELAKLGALALPELQKAAASNEIELAKRAKAILAQIKDRVPPKDLRVAAHDTVVTPTFTIVGRVLTPTLKAQSEYFGEVQMTLAQMRTLRTTGHTVEASATIDAAKFGGQAMTEWMPTSIKVESRTRLSITAAGTVDIYPGVAGINAARYQVGPRGYSGPTTGFVVPGPDGVATVRSKFAQGALVGRIGENGTPFLIGDQFEGPAPAEGTLYLQVSPSRYTNEPVGAFQVKILAR